MEMSLIDDHADRCGGEWTVRDAGWFVCGECGIVATSRNALWYMDRRAAMKITDPTGVQQAFLSACGLPARRTT
jgi:hypothetical protein